MSKRKILRVPHAAERSALENFDAFIAKMMQLNPLCIDNWDDDCWRSTAVQRASVGKDEKIWFTSDFVAKSTQANARPFRNPYGNLLRAIVCARESGRKHPRAVTDHMLTVRAFRYLYKVVEGRTKHPVDLKRVDFDAAAAACRREAASSSYRVGCRLQEVARIIDREYLAYTRLNWMNPIPRDMLSGGSKASRISSDFFERRASKLPGGEILEALAEISNRMDLRPQDLLRQRAVELLICGGFRCNELLTLPRDVWVEELAVDRSGSPRLDQLGMPIKRCGLRYLPEKGGHTVAQVKWLPSALVDVARRAVEDILRITDPFAQVANYLEQNAEGTLLAEVWGKLCGDSLLSASEVAALVGFPLKPGNNGEYGLKFIKHERIPFITAPHGGRHVLKVRKRDVEAALRRRSLPPVVSYGGDRTCHLHDLLFLVGVNFIGTQRSLLNGTVRLLTQGQLADYLCDRGGERSIFSRLGYRGQAGGTLRVATHQFRHWLNTLAQEGGLSQIEISRWMGRRRVSDNAAYDHQTGFELADRIRDRLGRGEVQGPVGTTVRRIREPVRREEFVRSMIASAHVTDIGMCIRDLSALPCDHHRSCMTCTDHLIEKGNTAQRTRAESLLSESQQILALAEDECGDESYGASNWVEYHKLVVRRAAAVLDLHSDDGIPDGTLVQLPSVSGQSSEK
ncbi:hypothetical protein [Burkholderia lata]|uniref:hypothetical protein n=1 Tax=Burkholderia lata (strain ATCC 17760 / DSM 23089 / LMG 22485 / NCIMB 9086 / R18194 / 383) TaxID=482957 RepID=UPI000B238DC9|nr:hypothetical protein [Burkholderia lata]